MGKKRRLSENEGKKECVWKEVEDEYVEIETIFRGGWGRVEERADSKKENETLIIQYQRG